jgi:hypothetical protein
LPNFGARENDRGYATVSEESTQFPVEELARYAGKYIAWDPDGTHVLASNEDEPQLAHAVVAAGLNSAEVLIAFVRAEDEVLLGGGYSSSRIFR